MTGGAAPAATAARTIRARTAAVLAAGLVFALSWPGGASGQDVTYPQAAQMLDGGQMEAAVAGFRALAQNGHTAAQVTLAGLYESGKVTGTPALPEAARWYRAAAEQGDPVAQMNLGELHAAGRGVPRDRVAAWVWLSRAGAQGLDHAARERDRVAAEMTESQLATARERLNGGS